MPYLLNVVRGFLMGAADVVPGVSGGTVALVLGIYERLVRSVHTAASALGQIARGRFTEAGRRLRQVEWSLVLPLLAGIGLAVLSLASLIDHLLEDQPQNTAAAFFGLVGGSILVAWRLVRRWDRGRVATGIAVAVAAFFLLGLRGDPVSDPSLPMFLIAGSIAIVAMILPGISGSFILVMLGMYQHVLDAVNQRDLLVVLMFLIGAVIGLSAFSTVLNAMLRDHHDTMMAALIGLMAGSLRVLWPWPDGAATGAVSAPVDWGVPLLMAITGFVVVTVIAWLADARRPTPDARQNG